MTEPSQGNVDPILRIGTSSWSCKDWVGPFYPPGTKSGDYLQYYATRHTTVEVDSTFYGVPKRVTVQHWAEVTPEHFRFSAKAPRAITHDAALKNCDRELVAFLDTMSLLGPRLGPILFQFPYFSKRSGMTFEMFHAALLNFLPTLPTKEFHFAVEVRNKTWLCPRLFETLHHHGVTLALIDHPWMFPPQRLFALDEIITGSFAYIRWLGDRKAIESMTKIWRETVLDREADFQQWVPPIQRLLERGVVTYGYVNNHYAGHSPSGVSWLQDRLGA
jgi:uncharacterized protein YecE (DUF72 family)